MAEIVGKKNGFQKAGMICGFLAIICCFVALGLSVNDSYFSIYFLCTALVLLGLNRVGLHLSNFKKNMFENIFLTAFVFVLALLVALTKFGIYFLITSMFLYSLTVIAARLLKIKEDPSPQTIVFNVLCIVFVFLFSFVFFFPAIYAKHATSVSNSNFIVLCFSLVVIVSSIKNIILPYYDTLKLGVISDILRMSLVYEIVLSLLILVVLCAVYFTVEEPLMTSYVDSLWYSFAVITTIGFGDVSVQTTLGRILSVILGIAGIVVVALFTSFIVNFYNEMNRKRKEKQLKDIIDEEIEEVIKHHQEEETE